MQSSLKDVTQKMTTVAERLDTSKQTRDPKRVIPRRNRRKSNRQITRDDYDGDSEDEPRGGKGPKLPKVNQFHVRINLILVSQSNFFPGSTQRLSA